MRKNGQKIAEDGVAIIKEFLNHLIELINVGRNNDNNIKNVLDILTDLIKLKAPEEEMSYVFAKFPYIKAAVIDKTEDFRYHMEILKKIENSLNDFFLDQVEKPSEENLGEFINFIKEKTKAVKKDIEIQKEFKKFRHP